MRYLGGYVPSGLTNGIENGENLGINTIMIHPSAPQRWKAEAFDKERVKSFNKKKKVSTVKKVHMHGIYLINLANPDNQKFHLSKISIVHYLNLAEAIDSPGVVFHTGSLKDTNEKEGFRRIKEGIEWIFDHAEESDKPLFLEVAAGAGRVVGSKFEDLARIKDSVKKYNDRVQFCLDTQHMWASGYDLQNELENIVDEIDLVLGINNVKCVHLNDSKTELDSKKDRHENLGEGKIGEEALKNFLNHPKLKPLDFILETPAMKKSNGESQKEIDKLLKWADD
jgi:deoxyribonuclease IV